jgi:hypothetical protein
MQAIGRVREIRRHPWSLLRCDRTGARNGCDWGSGEVYGGTGGVDVYTAVSGETGFRLGTDHVGGSGSAVIQGANTLVTLSNGSKIELFGVTTTAQVFG